jgi:D-tyrosyl-tRNA(Tyr) deacylase
MKIVVQRSKKSHVSVNEKIFGSINEGLVLLVCMEKGDGVEQLEKAARKILALRTFEENGKMNRNIIDVGGEILCISQFTLAWQGEKGNRPGFDNAMKPDDAQKLFKTFCDILSEKVTIV